MFAIIKTGGKQYKCEVGKVIEVEKLELAIGENVTFTDVVLVADGSNVATVKSMSVVCQAVRHTKADKVIAFRKHRRTSEFTRTKGHRQKLTSLLVKEINNK